jgi:glutathione S-transferase
MSAFTPVTIYYWPMFGRGGSAIRMLEHAGAPYNHVSDMPSLAAKLSAFGCTSTDNFAPPLLIDGDEHISQSTAVAMHIGNKCGLNEGITNPAKAVQHLADIVDLFELGVSGALNQGGAALKAYLEGDRLPKLLGNMERGIKGPFFFGDSPTYVDFFLCAHIDWLDFTLFDRLTAEKSVGHMLTSYSKMRGVVDGIRALGSYLEYKGPLKTGQPNFRVKDEILSAYE